MSRELVKLLKTDETVKISNGSSINFKLYKYIYNWLKGYLVYDVLEDYRSESQIVNHDTIMMPLEALQAFKKNVTTITDALEKCGGKMQRDVWVNTDMLTLTIKTKNKPVIPDAGDELDRDELDSNPLATPASTPKKSRKSK